MNNAGYIIYSPISKISHLKLTPCKTEHFSTFKAETQQAKHISHL